MSKILFVFNHPAPYKIDLFNELAKHHDLTVIFERQRNHDRPECFYHDKQYRFTAKFIRGVNFGNENHLSFSIIQHLKKNVYDLIIINGYSTLTEVLTLNYLIRKKIPYLLYFNGTFNQGGSKLAVALKRKFIRHARYCLTSTSLADDALKAMGAKSENIYHYPYSTVFQGDLSKRPLTNEEITQFKLDHNLPLKPLFLVAGQYISRKNNLALIALFAKRPDYALLLIGGGKKKQKYLNYIQKHHLTNIYLRPYLKKIDLLKYYQASSSAITLSKNDIYGHMVNESFSQGIPVISSPHVTSARYLINPGRNGYIVNNEEEVLKALDEVLTLNAYNDSLKVAQKNTIEIMVETHLDIFRRILP